MEKITIETTFDNGEFNYKMIFNDNYETYETKKFDDILHHWYIKKKDIFMGSDVEELRKEVFEVFQKIQKDTNDIGQWINHFNSNINKIKNKKVRKPITSNLRHEVFKRDKFSCCDCGANKDKNNVMLHLDHIISVSQGGTDEFSNLQTLCNVCNMSKSNRTWFGGNSTCTKRSVL